MTNNQLDILGVQKTTQRMRVFNNYDAISNGDVESSFEIHLENGYTVKNIYRFGYDTIVIYERMLSASERIEIYHRKPKHYPDLSREERIRRTDEPTDAEIEDDLAKADKKIK